jgi:hypothetical protein
MRFEPLVFFMCGSQMNNCVIPKKNFEFASGFAEIFKFESYSPEVEPTKISDDRPYAQP